MHNFSIKIIPFLPIYILRFGIAFVFGYAAITGLMLPEKYMKWVPASLLQGLNPYLTLHQFLFLFFIFELLLVVLIISGYDARLGALVMAILLLVITALNYKAFDIVFRNIGLICAALSLAILERRKQLYEVNSQSPEVRP